MELLSLLIGTVALRPYVFAFLVIFLFLASQQLGWKRSLIWTVTGYFIAFLCEYSSIHYGFPFGDYYYIDTTRNQELWVAGVPFMDSLSFSFLSFAGYSCAWQLLAAIRSRRTDTLIDKKEYLQLLRSPWALILGAVITTLMDVIIDPITLMGDQWFLGLIYGYRHEGSFFGVPMTNFAGWFFVSAVIIGVNQLIGISLSDDPPVRQKQILPYIHLGGFALFFFVAGFNVAVALWLKALGPSLSGIFITVVFLWTALATLKKGGLLTPYFLPA